MQFESNNEVSSPQKDNRPFFREVLESVAIAVLLAVIIRLFILEPFYIPSGSMEPTLKENDRIIVSKLNYHFQEPKRGDVVVFKYPLDTKRNFVKRMIAVGGETVAIKNSVLYINGQRVSEDYLPQGLRFADYGPVEVPAGSYFMMGDNRNNSDDSRVWGFLPKELIVGKAVVIYWPPGRAGVVQ
ncbi:MAG: Signal peptidase I T [Pelotomaculum sp. PtaB.Bin013]|uniref:Signal peptidase I n=1 Tax=Pelotomaculum isophthalicicum JI TaxID=947010 RepID=A0A9X4GY55_9FIRM|nr:signal peptidase I [Pelotomaculum isophthalicicum]MDF9407447.1 signal peptidase I [Pelotomaculum isophthalicicum JI]OPX90308.1 MAG: Signal peptidase I T [Pelotomaculum sp. PtaB.Bin013]